DSLDLLRPDNPHVSFGAGIHYCVGAPLARIEVEVAMIEFARAVEEYALGETPQHLPSFVFRGVGELPLELSSRPSYPSSRK
ncbi:MAG: hypothetical protein Q8Q52_06610, partial [Acidimicrobiia bacterium]|nr:hypothetical protein [Acidimicrobiia bacterium]